MRCSLSLVNQGRRDGHCAAASTVQEDHEECFHGEEIVLLPDGSVRCLTASLTQWGIPDLNQNWRDTVRPAALFGRPRPPLVPLPEEGRRLISQRPSATKRGRMASKCARVILEFSSASRGWTVPLAMTGQTARRPNSASISADKTCNKAVRKRNTRWQR